MDKTIFGFYNFLKINGQQIRIKWAAHCRWNGKWNDWWAHLNSPSFSNERGLAANFDSNLCHRCVQLLFVLSLCSTYGRCTGFRCCNLKAF